MSKTRTLSLFTTCLLVALTLPASAYADAGIANFVFGDVAVRSANGSTAPLQKGRAVQSGDDIVTGVGAQAQIRFSDGGMVAIQPNSQFKLTSYADRNDPKTDSFLVELARGGMRAITGLIGKRNRENYKVITSTATIGIRGSSFLISYNTDGSVTVNAEQDAIVVCTNTGCTGLTAGETVVVKDKNQDPTRTSERASTEAAVPPPQSQTVSGDKVLIANGLHAVFQSDAGAAVANNTNGQSTAVIADLPLVSYADSDGSLYKAGTSGVSSFNTSGDPYAADYIGWGYWASGTKTTGTASTALSNVHYIVARPTPELSMPNTGTFTFNLIGGTAPTASSGGTVIVGALSGASMSVNFNGGYTSINSVTVDTVFNGNTYSGYAYGSGTGATFSASGSMTVNGVFSGDAASKAALTYKIPGTAVGNITGAVGLGKGAETTNYAQ
jgi:hypothetical protein